MGKQIGFGATAGVYVWGDGRVLKLYNHGVTESSVHHEAEATASVHALGLAVPAVDGIVEVDGRLGIVFERLEGPTLLEHFAARPWRLFVCARQLAELQVALHRCVAPDLPPLHRQLRWHIEHADCLSAPARSAVLDSLERLPDGDRVCHWDFHPDNVILTERGPFIIDWMGGARGDAAADLARTSVLLRTSQVPAGRAGGGLGRLAVLVFYREYRHHYLRLLPTPHTLASAWEIPVAAARLIEHRPPAENERLKRIVLRGLAGASV